MTKHAKLYQKFLNLTTAVDGLIGFPILTADEKHLIRGLNSYWVKGEVVTVVQAMQALNARSTSTVFRNMKKLREKGYLELEIDEIDNRVKYVQPTKLLMDYFSARGKVVAKMVKECAGS